MRSITNNFNPGYAKNRARPTMQQRAAAKERREMFHIDAEQDCALGTVDADFELLDLPPSLAVHIGGDVVVSLGCSRPMAHRRAA